jgi:MarR family transcriptional regulator, organic hydroperoxide resistance regulator
VRNVIGHAAAKVDAGCAVRSRRNPPPAPSSPSRPAKKRSKQEEPADDYLRLDNQLCFPLYAAARMMVNAYGRFLSELGLTYPQYLVLLVLWENDGLSVNAIGERLYLDSGTLTPLLQRMSQQGLIVRRRSEPDDRVVANWLTDAGKALKARATDIPVQMLCSAQIDVGEVAPMKAVMHRLIDALLPMQRTRG